ncbi:DUF3238 domain-containing protein [Halocalculus aciditolerans]|uniref:DUF3238 domain-containing protein n=1 Tax=Halocalculus aciditolerans TaxID=1383812 RepID=UPI001668CC24|nr:DUF3238 domain-containing protein [Halocalculus aciditolerans]
MTDEPPTDPSVEPGQTSTVRVRYAVFIPDEWIEPRPVEEATVEFEGDDRGFTPYAAWTGRSRVEAEATADFDRGEVVFHADTGRSRKRVTDAAGVTMDSGTADTTGLALRNVEWAEDEETVSFRLALSAGNPLVEEPATVDAEVDVTANRRGVVEVSGRHDGYPNHECYASVDFGVWEDAYRYAFREHGGSPRALAGDLDEAFDWKRP